MEYWWNEYEALMFGKDRTIETMEKAALLKFQHMPNRLYKYRQMEERYIDSFKKGVLFAATVAKMNDFDEANLVFSENAKAKIWQRTYDSLRKEYGLPEAAISSSDEFINYVETYYRNKSDSNKVFPKYILNILKDWALSEFNRMIDNTRDEYKKAYNICSFSANNRIERMWERYANNGTGFCIEYDFKSAGLSDENVQLMLPVIYREDNTVLINDIDEVNGSLSMYAFSLKNDSEWGYECEWRRFYLHNTDLDPQKMPIPTAVYLGERVKDDSNKERLIDNCRENEIPVFQMRSNSGSNELEAFSINE